VGWRWRERKQALAFAFASICLIARSSAGTAPIAESAGSYRAPRECPNHGAWRAALRARAGAEPAKLLDRLVIEIERRGNDATPTYEGWLGPRDAGTTSRAGRRVRGATCREVFEALTLIARLGLLRMSEPALSSQPALSSTSEGPVAAPTRAPLAWTLTAQQELELARDPLPEAVSPAPESESPRLAATALALWGGASRATRGADWGLALGARWKGDGLQPFLLAGVYGGREQFGVSGTPAQARLERLALHAVACPLRVPREAAIGIRPCVDLDAGVLRGSGVSVEGARGHTAPWVSTGVQIRAEWSAWGPLELGAMIGGVVALSRPRFYLVPDTTAFQADATALRAGATAGLSF
jgi:hypothetical protein